MTDASLTRRGFVQGAAIGAATAVAGGLVDRAWARLPARRAPLVSLPSPAQFRAEVQQMVDFGPRLPGYAAHNAFCDWLEEEFVEAGLELETCDEYLYNRWDLKRYALDILDGPSPGASKVAFPYVRSASTGTAGVSAPLVYAAANAGGAIDGKIVVIDVPVPARATAALFTALETYRYWPGHTDADWLAMDYTRPWIGPWPSDLSAFADRGAKAVILIAQGSYDALAGGFTPHQAADQPLPVLIVDRDTGAALRQQAITGRTARLTLDAPVQKSSFRNVTAILPGESDETIIVDTHTDGQNAVEENAGVALVQMARHFASLPRGQRLKRTLVFAAWAAHMTDTKVQPEADGWIAAHPDLVKRAVAAVTLEHLGCTEWIDDPVKGYHGTGQNELYGIWTTQGPTFDLAKAALINAGLDRHTLMRGPVEFTVGGIFQQVGIPNIGGIAGPTYLLIVSESGEIEKLNFDLAAKQIGFYADMIRKFDAADAAALKTGDPTLNGQPMPTTVKSKSVVCGPRDYRQGRGDGRAAGGHRFDRGRVTARSDVRNR